MPIHLIIDGYNLMYALSPRANKWGTLLEEERNQLIRKLSAYKEAKGFPVTVIFDAANAGSLNPSSEQQKGIKVVFTSIGESADELIKKKAMELGEKAVIVTSDRNLQQDVTRYGSAVISSADFLDRMELAFFEKIKGIDVGAGLKPAPDHGSQKKKGLSHRLPKKARKALPRLKKL